MTIKQLRAATYLSQSKFARILGIPAANIPKWEQGVSTPPAYVVGLIQLRLLSLNLLTEADIRRYEHTIPAEDESGAEYGVQYVPQPYPIADTADILERLNAKYGTKDAGNGKKPGESGNEGAQFTIEEWQKSLDNIEAKKGEN